MKILVSNSVDQGSYSRVRNVHRGEHPTFELLQRKQQWRKRSASVNKTGSIRFMNYIPMNKSNPPPTNMDTPPREQARYFTVKHVGGASNHGAPWASPRYTAVQCPPEPAHLSKGRTCDFGTVFDPRISAT